MSRKQKDGILRGCIYGCAGFTVLILVVIIGAIILRSYRVFHDLVYRASHRHF